MGILDPMPAHSTEDQQAPTPVQSLEYRAVPPDVRRRNRVVLGLLLVGVLIAVPLLLVGLFVARATRVVAPRVVLGTPVPVPPASINVVDFEQQRREQAYEQYLAHASPSGVVVYDEDPVRGAKLVSAQPQKHRQTSTGSVDPAWASSFDRPVIEIMPAGVAPVPPFSEVSPGIPDDRALLFVGKLRSPGGNARLVFVDMKIALSGQRGGGGGASGRRADTQPAEFEVTFRRKLEYRIFDATAATSGYPNQLRRGTSLTIKTSSDVVPVRWIDGTLRADRPAGAAAQIFAGTLDPADPSHAAVAYEYAGIRSAIDVYLTDDDFLRILPRTGQVSGGIWDVGAAPAADKAVEGATTQPSR